MKRIFCLILVLAGLLCACGGKGDTPETNPFTLPPVSDPSSGASTPSGSSSPENPTTEPTEPPVLYRNPLNGAPMDAPYDDRVVTVMLNNIRAAMPQHGNSDADILYEVLAEGGITRCMGVFSDISQVEKLGSLRSARKYYVDLTRSYNAMYVHVGGSAEAANYLHNVLGWDDMDGLYVSDKYMYRDQDRLNSGYSYEHTCFTDGNRILEYAQQKNYDMTAEPGKTYGLTFADTPEFSGQTTNKISVYFNMDGEPSRYTKLTQLTYDPESHLYSASQHGGPYIDGNTGKALTFRNVMVLRASHADQGDASHHLTIVTTGSGKGYFSCDGKMVPILWSRSNESEPFTYTLEDGTPLTVGVGKTYIAVVPNAATVDFE